MPREELKPCPFCGGEGELITRGTHKWSRVAVNTQCHILCGGCWATGPIGKTAADAIAAWNRRADA